MTRLRAVLLGAAACCLAAAVLLALLARDVGAQQKAMRSGDLVAADPAAARPPSWQASELVPFGLGRKVLAVDDDLAFRKAVALFRRAHTGIPSFELGLEGTAIRVQAETALAQVLHSDHDPSRTSAAANLLGVLAYVDATSTGNNQTPVDRSIFEFQDAIHLQPDNEQAKANLELVYQQ